MVKPPKAANANPLERLSILGLILLGWALLVAFRLCDLQIFSYSTYARMAASQQDRIRQTQAPRGAIFDRRGGYLALSCPSRQVVVDTRRMPDKEVAAAILGRVLEMTPAKLQADLENAAASRNHRAYYVVDANVPQEKADALQAMKLEWLEVRQGSLRSYPNGQLAAHVVGNVNSEGRGAAGIELKLEKDLAGKAGEVRVKVDVKGRPYDSEIVKTPVTGRNIGLTIDSELQHIAEETLKSAVVKNHADHGSLVAMDPYSGEIRALANYPTYDPNERLHAGDRATGREDLAVVAPFEPGSVFKVVTISAAMETTNLRPGTMINCGGGVMTLFSRVIHDSHAHSDLSVEDVLAKSSNIGAIRIGMQVGNKNLYDYIRKFGFGRRTGIELPAEAPGMVRPLNRWQPTSIGSVPMGHEISVTSIQLARLGAVIANGGYLVKPHLVAWEQEPGERRQKTDLPQPSRVLEPKTAALLRGMMHKVTMKGGTAEHLHIPGYTFAGKTGTAQIYDYAHRVYTHRYNASFLGFAPVNKPRLVVIVTVAGTTGVAGFGGTAAGPVFEAEMGTALRQFGVPRDVPQDIEELVAKKAAIEKKLHPNAAKEVDEASLSTPLNEDELKQAEGDASTGGAGAQVLAESDPNAPRVPNFVGKTVRDVMLEASASGFEVDLFGDGLARTQNPQPGARLLPGAHIHVRFAR